MVIKFKSIKLAKLCNSSKNAQRKWGPRRGKLVLKRLDEMRDSENLQDLLKLPQARCHLLKADLAGKWSVDLEHPYRLLFEPYHDPMPLQEDGGLDLAAINIVQILGVEDTHG